MPTVKHRVRHTYEVEADDRVFAVTFPPADDPEPLVHVLADGRAVVGYLSHDDHDDNPLDDDSALGRIYDARDRGEGRNNFCRVMHCDTDGNKEGEPDPYAVLLDVYSHSGEVWRVHGSNVWFPDEQWDVSHGCGVWAPDDSCLEHIRSEAYKRVLPAGVNIQWVSGGKVGYTLPDGRTRTGYKNFVTAARAAARALGIRPTKEALHTAEREVAVECAGQAVAQYNLWLSGDSWGVVVETFAADGSNEDEDSCWGYLGSDYALEELQRQFDAEVASLLKEVEGGK